MKLVIGLVGQMGSGKTTLASNLKKDGFVMLSFSMQLEKEVKKRKLSLERVNYQNVADELRKKKGAGYLSSLLLREIKRSSEGTNFIVEGFRHPAEIAIFRKLTNFFLLGIKAPQKVRYQRLISKNNERSPKNWQDFLNQENRDNGKREPEWGLKILDCLRMADFIISTNKSQEAVYRQVKNLIRKLQK